MPIRGISGEFRPPRQAKIRLGYKPLGKNYPKDADVFVGKMEDGLTKEIVQAYGKGTIEGAEGEAWNLGKSLRMMSYFEWDRVHPRRGAELVVGLLNRAWAHSTLHCSGDGGETVGQAFARDEAYMTAITKTTKTKAKARDGGWDVVCMGPKCAMWHTNNKANSLATCHRELRFLAQLLHPATNPEDPNYMKNFGSVEIVSGSFNGMLDVQSGLQLLREVAGRSFNVPFNLQRVPRTMLVEGKRLVKATLVVSFDNDEAIRFGYSDPKLSIVRPAVRKQLMAQRREQLELARMEVDYDSVKDVLPQLEAHDASRTTSPDADALSDGEPVTADRDDVVQQAVDEAEPRQLSKEELNRLLSKDERNELKVLTGGVPGQPSTLAKLREFVTAAYRAFDERPSDLSDLRVRHALWIRDALAQESRDSDQREAAATESAGLESQRHEETPGAVNPDSPESVQQELIK